MNSRRVTCIGFLEVLKKKTYKQPTFAKTIAYFITTTSVDQAVCRCTVPHTYHSGM